MSSAFSADPLPGTQPLTEQGDLARKMVDGLHAYLDRELAAAPEKRKAIWKPQFSSPAAFDASIQPHRDRLRKLLGVVDPRVPPRLEYVGGPDAPALVAETKWYKVYAVRWATLPGVDAEGLLLEPTVEVRANVVAVPDADQTPEQIAGLAAGVEKGSQFARRLAEDGNRVLVPTLIDHRDEHSANPKLNRATNQPHREFVHRMAYQMGRTLVGYEVQKVLAAVDWFATRPDPWVSVWGYGEGGRIALYAGAIDERIRLTAVSGAVSAREAGWEEPLDRNVWGFSKEFGDAELLLLCSRPAPKRRVTSVEDSYWPKVSGPPAPRPGRSGAAPGRLTTPTTGRAEYDRFNAMIPADDTRVTRSWQNLTTGGPIFRDLFDPDRDPSSSVRNLRRKERATEPTELRKNFDPAARQKRQFDQLVAYTQKLWRDSDATRKAYWKKADPGSPEKWEQTCEWYRRYFHEEVIGKLPDSTMPLNPRTRQVYDTPKWTGHEVVLDVYPDVIASGILLLPKDMKPGERRPVVVCQHGLEGRPADVCNPKERTKYYNSFGAQLADRGYVVYAPQNPYIFENHFRQVQRKANPLGLSLFSFIIAQHKRTIDWLETLPQVDPKRIAFYGLSYGGKTAMRVPAVEKRYCLSICSGDFNEWVGKNVTVDLDRSYMWTREYEMYEFDLGNTFNYAEMAYLIAPRPFMVERGHDDGVGTDEMVAYEYAKVRYLYANKLRLPDRTAIEFFPGGHEINGKGTFAFLQKHLAFPN